MTQLLCKWNGYTLYLQTDELADMFIAIASGQADTETLEYWLKAHIRKV